MNRSNNLFNKVVIPVQEDIHMLGKFGIEAQSKVFLNLLTYLKSHLLWNMDIHLHEDDKTYERGNILVASLMILLVMNLLGIGLANLATKEWSMANYKTIDAEVFHTTEGCSQDVIVWFGTQTATPTSISTFTATAVSRLSASQTSNSDIANKLTGYSYSCTVNYITSKSAPSSRSSGGEIGNSGGSYGTTGNQVLKDYYTINSTGSGPKNSSKVINTIISVEY